MLNYWMNMSMPQRYWMTTSMRYRHASDIVGSVLDHCNKTSQYSESLISWFLTACESYVLYYK